MKIACIGGGPAGLYFSILMKQERPDAHIEVFERNKVDDTFGWGVVFSDETLGHFEEADPVSFKAITERFVYWSDIETFLHGECVRSTGHGFCGMSRKELLQILARRAADLGVELSFETEVDVEEIKQQFDLVVAADGIHSKVREGSPQQYEPSVDMRKCRFTWLGTTKPLEAFTFIFKENEHGAFMVHAYPYLREADGTNLGTWIVECHEDTWRNAGLDQADDDATVAYCEKLFEKELEGHRLLSNRSIWRQFPTVKNERWHEDNVVLMGDAAHSAHFSIGSGTKLAMEDAIYLRDAFRANPGAAVPQVLEAYQESRYVETLKLQKAAQTSLEWFENARRYLSQDPVTFTFNLMTRSKRITYDNLALRDPELVEQVTRRFATAHGAENEPDGRAPAPIFVPFRAGGLTLDNRIVVSPMCQYSATDGVPNDWHLVHLGSRAVGGAGLVFTEMTNVTSEGRITHGCTGLYTDEQEAAWKRVVDFVHGNSAAKIGIQLAHAGRKASCNLPWEGDDPLTDDTAWPAIGPSAEPFGPNWPAPKAMDDDDLARIRLAFVDSTERALRAGFDVLELHMAHGYLLSSFLSPAANKRTDQYGGSLENRMRYPLEVLSAVREVWPTERALFVRISATDWLEETDPEGGVTIDESVEIAKALKAAGCDVIDVSTAGNTPRSKPIYGRMYQVPFAERIRYEAGVPVMAVGAIQGADQANTVVAAGRADLCALARPHLEDPYLTQKAAADYRNAAHHWPNQYLAVRPRGLDDPS